MSEQSLVEIYNGIIEEKKKRDITSSTGDVIAKAHPKSPLILDYEQELFGLSPEEVKRLPIKSVEMLQSALKHLIDATKKEPTLRQALRKMINYEFKEATEEEKVKKESVEITDEMIIESYKEFVKLLVESKATKFNYKMLLDLEPNKINNPFFTQLLTTFNLVELTRPQKQGVMLMLKKLAELADTNTSIAQSLNRIIRIENKVTTEVEGQ